MPEPDASNTSSTVTQPSTTPQANKPMQVEPPTTNRHLSEVPTTGTSRADSSTAVATASPGSLTAAGDNSSTSAIDAIAPSDERTPFAQALERLADASNTEDASLRSGPCPDPASVTNRGASAQAASSQSHGQPYEVPIRDLFNFNEKYWTDTVERWGIRHLDAELEAYGLLDLDADGEEDIENESYDACR